MKDGHVHSPYCLHGSKDSFQTYIEKAIASGIEEISFTEHFPLPNGFEDPVKEKDSSMDLESLEKYINENSLVIKDNVMIEKSILNFKERVQFMRHGYFIRDNDKELVFNRIVSLKKSYR